MDFRAVFGEANYLPVLKELKDYDPTGVEMLGLTQTNNSTQNTFEFQDKESLSNVFGLNGLNDFGPRFLDKTIGGIWSATDILGELNANSSLFNYLGGRYLNMVDPTGMMADSTGGSGRVPGAESSMQPSGTPSGDIPLNHYQMPNYGSMNLYQKAKDFVLSDGPSYNQMGSFRQGLNDLANSSFIKNISEWNPYYNGMNAFSGLVSGKGLYGNKMGGGSITLSALSVIPFTKITKVVGKGSLAISKANGKAMETALGMSTSKVSIKVAGKIRFPDRLANGLLEESKNVKHLNFTNQLRDYLQFSQKNGLDMILHTRPSTTFSKPLQKLIDNGTIIHNKVPGF